MSTYLVTGATGLIGRHIVQLLAERADADEIILLVRDRSRARLAEQIRGLPGQDRIQLLVGDLGQDHLGLSTSARDALRGRVDHLIHAAALYDLAADNATSVEANVDGTQHMLDLAADLHVRRLHHLSSVAVAGDYRGKFAEDMFDAGQRLVTPYHRTKFASEELVREQHAVPWRIYRPAVVVGHSITGEMDKIDGPYYFFPTLARMAALPWMPVLIPDIGATNIVPVDYVAAALVHIAHADDLDGQVFQLVNPDPQPAAEVYNAFAKAAGAPQITGALPRQASKPLLELAKLTEYVPGAGLLRDGVLDWLGIPPAVLSVLTFPSVFDSSATRRALADSDIHVPPLDDYAPALWRYWREHLNPYRARVHHGRTKLDGRRIVITGASSGIGRATALRVSAEGGIPLLLARRAEELEEVRTEIRSNGGAAYAYPCDLTDPESVRKTVDQMLAEQPAIDMLVNNAGRSIRRSVRLSYDRFHDYERAMAINYFGALRLILALLPHMTERKFGHIVNVSSIGVQGIAPRFSAYVASKSALDQFSKVAATETFGDGVTFTTVHMPLVRTPMIRPTKIYDAFPAKSPEQAADMIIQALEERPKHMGTGVGFIMQLAYAISPDLVDAIAYQGYRIFPDSTAAGGQGRVKLGKSERQLSKAAAALVRMTRGIHW
ncbi:SDR family oxidoreductase [Fodinicola feengrottensis]|uniref:SDR family oxidoreductase n=1 Tax=Fodinicola feengrottensis TaxID=435914 RepID=A0ABN2INK6_9ACTN